MKYDVGTFFEDHADPTTPGFTIIEKREPDHQYRLAEKWENSDGSRWITYWVKAEKLHDRVDAGKAEKAGLLSDDQFEAVCQNTDPRALEA